MFNYINDLEDKYHFLLEYSREILIFFDKQGKIIECNKAARGELGYGDEIYRLRIEDIFRKAFTIQEENINVKEKLIDKVTESVAYRKNQTCFPVEIKISILSHNKFYGVCAALNVTDRKEAIRKLNLVKYSSRVLSKKRNEFVTNISHELRTPLNGILGLTQNLLDSKLTPSQQDIVNIIHQCSSSMTAIIKNLLDYSDLESRKLTLEIKEFDFKKFVDNIVAFNINKINEKGLKLLLNIANNIPERLSGDVCRLTQIMNNLMSNAIKFTTVGKIILEVVLTSQTEEEVELFFMIMDTGIGISEEDRYKLFRSFSQLDGSITRNFGGTGLGLAICKNLAELMHGKMYVSSEKGKGSTFSFSVKLGIAKQHYDRENYLLQDIDSLINRQDLFPANNVNADVLSDAADYLSKMYGGFLYSYKDSNLLNSKSNYVKDEGDNIFQDILSSLERLIICIEMESWYKAESISSYIKNSVPKEYTNIKKSAFLLALAVRKEDHDQALSLIKELQEVIREMK